MAIENGNRVFYVQFLQPISLKESRKVPSAFGICFAYEHSHQKNAWEVVLAIMHVNKCVCVQCCAIFYVHSQQPFSCKHIIRTNKYTYVPMVQV
jgi:hypothetical protein